MSKQFIQIDVKKVQDGFAHCNLQTGGRDVAIIMKEEDYDGLMEDGFFLRDGTQRDSAKVWNTTKMFFPKK